MKRTLKLLLLAWLFAAGGAFAADAPVAQPEHPQPLPPAVVAAWESAGAAAGWVDMDAVGYWKVHRAATGKKGEVPAFRLSEWKPGAVAKLPPPPAAFGLGLSATQVTDAGLKELAGFKNLQTLNLMRTPVTDAGLRELSDLKNLQVLYLSGTRVTDVGMSELAGLKNLRTLDLAWTAVTDAGLPKLAELTSLQSLRLGKTQVTEAGAKWLQQRLPKCRILR